jgi:uncharacterized short protein YbdD (DUF466 family)
VFGAGNQSSMMSKDEFVDEFDDERTDAVKTQLRCAL